MLKVKNSYYYEFRIVEIQISGGSRTNEKDFFEDKITFIFNPLEDTDLYDLCEKAVNEYEKENIEKGNISNDCIYNAFAETYTLDRQLVHSFDVL